MKNGIAYFPWSAEIDPKHRLLKAICGLEGLGILQLVLQLIYCFEGYYYRWTEKDVYLLACENSISKESVRSVISNSLEIGIFNNELYEKYGILTSKEIQNNFIEAAKRRKSIDMNQDYLLVNLPSKNGSVDISAKNVDISEKNADISQQSRVEENRADKIRVDKGADAQGDACGTTAAPEKENIDFHGVGEAFNRICTSLTPVQGMSGRRKTAICETYELVKSRGGFEKLFETVRSSDFLCGKNKMGWKATFDWVIKTDNAVKILEGNFGNKKAREGSFDTDDFFKAALRKSYGEMIRPE